MLIQKVIIFYKKQVIKRKDRSLKEKIAALFQITYPPSLMSKKQEKKLANSQGNEMERWYSNAVLVIYDSDYVRQIDETSPVL